jgi:hypothetical protein
MGGRGVKYPPWLGHLSCRGEGSEGRRGEEERKVFAAQQWGTGAFDRKFVEQQLLLPGI